MAEHPNVELSRRGYKAFSEGDMATLAELIAEDAVWHVGGNNILTGDYEGRDAIFGLFARYAESNPQIEVHDILANDGHTVVLTHLTASRQGKTVDTRTNDTSHTVNGQLTEFWTFAEDQAGIDELWSA